MSTCPEGYMFCYLDQIESPRKKKNNTDKQNHEKKVYTLCDVCKNISQKNLKKH